MCGFPGPSKCLMSVDWAVMPAWYSVYKSSDSPGDCACLYFESCQILLDRAEKKGDNLAWTQVQWHRHAARVLN